MVSMKGRKTSTGSRKRNRSNVSSRVRRLPPSADAARDEGPRLLPLGDRVSEPSKLEHYLDLADAALGLKKDSGEAGEKRKIYRAAKTP